MNKIKKILWLRFVSVLLFLSILFVSCFGVYSFVFAQKTSSLQTIKTQQVLSDLQNQIKVSQATGVYTLYFDSETFQIDSYVFNYAATCITVDDGDVFCGSFRIVTN